jgi:recombination protein RecT
MTNTAVAQAQSPKHPLLVIRALLEQNREQIHRALPRHISVDRFNREVETLVNINGEIAAVDRKSLIVACLQAAHDGLLPDRREGIILPYREKSGRYIAQWQPMVDGLLKRFRNSGQFRSISSGVVREGEEFSYWIDEHGDHIRHVPGDEIGKILKAYAIAHTKDGGVLVRVMSVAEINKRRAVSKAKDGPMWKDWYPEAAQKTVLRALAKRLPSSSDLYELLHRDDDENAFETPSTRDADLVQADGDISADMIDVTPDDQTASDEADQYRDAEHAQPPGETEPSEIDRAFAEGAEARRVGSARRAVPGPYREPQASHLAKAWWSGWDSAQQRS